jgi:hypothetical protein
VSPLPLLFIHFCYGTISVSFLNLIDTVLSTPLPSFLSFVHPGLFSYVPLYRGTEKAKKDVQPKWKNGLTLFPEYLWGSNNTLSLDKFYFTSCRPPNLNPTVNLVRQKDNYHTHVYASRPHMYEQWRHVKHKPDTVDRLQGAD